MAGGDLDSALACDLAENGAADRRLGWYALGHSVVLSVARALDYLHTLQPAVRAACRMRLCMRAAACWLRHCL
jgi:hypothetical protein